MTNGQLSGGVREDTSSFPLSLLRGCIVQVTGVDNRLGGTNVNNRQWSVAGGERGKIYSFPLSLLLMPVSRGLPTCQQTWENAVVGRSGALLRRKVREEEDELLPSSPPVEDPSIVGRNL